MRKINNARAQLIYNEYQTNDCGMVITDAIKRFFHSSPSYSEVTICKRKGCSAAPREAKYALIQLNDNVFNADFANLEISLEQNFPVENRCPKCHTVVNNVKRTFGEHLFIEVKSIHATCKHFINECFHRFQVLLL